MLRSRQPRFVNVNVDREPSSASNHELTFPQHDTALLTNGVLECHVTIAVIDVIVSPIYLSDDAISFITDYLAALWPSFKFFLSSLLLIFRFGVFG